MAQLGPICDAQAARGTLRDARLRTLDGRRDQSLSPHSATRSRPQEDSADLFPNGLLDYVLGLRRVDHTPPTGSAAAIAR